MILCMWCDPVYSGRPIFESDLSGPRYLERDPFLRPALSSWKLPFAVLLLSSVFCADTPQTHPVAVIIMGAALSWLIVQFIVFRAVPLNLVSVGFGSLLLVLLISLPVALGNGTSFFDWALRGFAPLFFLAVFFLLRLRDRSDVSFVIGAILVASMLWSLLVFVDLVQHYDLLHSTRWTLISSQLLLPFNIVGIAFIILGTRVLPDRVLFPLLFALLVLTLGGGYRSHLILIIAIFGGALALALFRPGSRHRIKMVCAILVLTLIPLLTLYVVKMYGSSTERIGEILSSISSAALNNRGDVARMLEFRYATTQFLDAPIFGKGLAYRVPSELIFNGQQPELAKIEADHGKKYPFVFYTHNSLGYLLMTTGTAGLVAFILIVTGLCRSAFDARALATVDERITASAAIVSLGLFSLISAVYLLPQFTIMIGALCAVIAAEQDH